jgi:hypothetical protein
MIGVAICCLKDYKNFYVRNVGDIGSLDRFETSTLFKVTYQL